MSTVKTLDYLAAKTAHEMVEAAKQHNAPKDIENVITKALGVLQAQGVYALYLYLYSQAGDNKPASYLLRFLWNELANNEVKVPLPSKVKVAPLQDNGVLFCEPLQVAGIEKRSFKTKGQAEEKCKTANDCVQQVRLHADLWARDKDNFDSFPEALGNLNLQYTPQQTRKSSQWKISPNEKNLHQQFIKLSSVREILLANIRDLTSDLDTLLLVRDLYEQTLIYARYHAKALKGEGGS